MYRTMYRTLLIAYCSVLSPHLNYTSTTPDDCTILKCFPRVGCGQFLFGEWL